MTLSMYRPESWKVVNEKDYIDLSQEKLVRLEEWFKNEREFALFAFETGNSNKEIFSNWEDYKRLMFIARHYHNANLEISDNGNIVIYRGFRGNLIPDYNSELLLGEIQGINHVVTFNVQTVKEGKEEFIQTVEKYIKFCLEE